MNALRGKVMFLTGKFIKPIASGVLLIGTALGFSTHSYASEADYSYVVSVQDTQGEKLCNGVYIGGNQVLIYQNCESSPFPIISPPLDSGSTPIEGIEINPSLVNTQTVNTQLMAQSLSADLAPIPLPPIDDNPIDPDNIDYSDDEYPIQFNGPGIPSQIVFTDNNGIDHAPVQIKRRVKNPYTGHQVIVAVRNVPNGVRSIPLANIEQVQALEEQENHPVQIVSRDSNGRLGIEDRTLTSYDNCQTGFPIPLPTIEQDSLNRQVCLNTVNPFCGFPGEDEITYGAPIVTKSLTGEDIVLAQKTSSCQSYPAASNHQRWANLMDMKSQGLQVAMAYDLGERDKLERPSLTIQFNNESADQKFDLSNMDLFHSDGFELLQNDCSTLLPQESCSADIKVDVSDSVDVKDMMTFTANNQSVGVYAAVQGIAYRFVKGDADALWKLKGWKKKGFFNKNLYTHSSMSDFPQLSRTRNVINPTTMSITYRQAGESTLGAFVNINRQEMFNTSGMFILGNNTLPGTNNEWVTKTFDIPVPGAYKIEINRFLIISGEDDFEMEISDICFGDKCIQ